MPWQEVSTIALRREFVTMVQHGTVNRSEVCRRCRISRKTGYKWLARFTAEGTAGLADRSRRPLSSPARTPGKMEATVIALRNAHPAWARRPVLTRAPGRSPARRVRLRPRPHGAPARHRRSCD